MLERKIGGEAMSAGLKRLTAESMGRHASWRQLQEAFESASGADLSAFFRQWVRRGGAPLLELVDARWQPGCSTHAWVSLGPKIAVPTRT